MLLRCLLFLVLLTLTSAQGQGQQGQYVTNSYYDPQRTLVLLSATTPTDSYYGKYYDAIRDFQVDFAKKVSGAGDNVIIMADPSVAQEYRDLLYPIADIVLAEGMADVWTRDWTTVRINNPTMFTYAPDYLQPQDSKYIQNKFYNMVKRRCPNVNINLSDIVLDGGNIVDNFIDRAFAARRVVPENPGHADGMVSFIDTNILAIDGTMRGQPQLWTATNNAIREQARDLYNNMLELDSVYQDQEFDGFSSACGLHVNSLLTEKNLYVPVFGSDPGNQQYGQTVGRDKRVISQIRAKLQQARSSRRVIEIDAPNQVCRMGGSVRCFSSAVQGPLAECLIKAVHTQLGK